MKKMNRQQQLHSGVKEVCSLKKIANRRYVDTACSGMWTLHAVVCGHYMQWYVSLLTVKCTTKLVLHFNAPTWISFWHPMDQNQCFRILPKIRAGLQINHQLQFGESRGYCRFGTHQSVVTRV